MTQVPTIAVDIPEPIIAEALTGALAGDELIEFICVLSTALEEDSLGVLVNKLRATVAVEDLPERIKHAVTYLKATFDEEDLNMLRAFI